MIKETKILSNVEKKRPRANFSNYGDMVKIPHLDNIQVRSYKNFIREKKNSDTDLHKILRAIFPIYSNSCKLKLEYAKYWLNKPNYTEEECILKGLTYSAPIRMTVHMCDNIRVKRYRRSIETVVQDIFLLHIPLMTKSGTFIINGTERIIVSQLHKAPGVFFEFDKSKIALTTKKFYLAKVIPQRGSWLDIEFDLKDCLYAKVDKRKKFPATIMLKALGLSTEEILYRFHLVESTSSLDKNLLDFIVASDAKDRSGSVIIPANTKITEDVLNIAISSGLDFLNVIDTNNKRFKPYVSNTLDIDFIDSEDNAILFIYKHLRSSDPITPESAKFFFESLFFSNFKYNLSQIGRMKMNERLKRRDSKNTFLNKNDIINIIKILINIKEKKDKVDDIDNLSYRRIRGIGEILGNFFKLGFFRADRYMRDKLSLAETENVTPQHVINAKALFTMLREFFFTSQLSQFMDQTNPLAEITHKRRISSLGPGGLTRERAGFEVRDVHNSHYGRLCPIETPEGPNIGLINSLAIYSKTDKFGFLETPYLRVDNGIVTNILKYFTSSREERFVIAQATVKVDKITGEILDDDVSCRFNNEFLHLPSNRVQYIEISPKQISSVAASLIPFLEHNDANRALMGSNMQRQAVPLLKTEKPLIGTGTERIIGIHSGTPIIAINDGVVERVDASKVIVRITSKNDKNKISFDIYNLIKYKRSNQNTCVNQKPLVSVGDKIKKNDLIADGTATDLGELALGQNLLTAFMTWNGYNFEDSIILSESVVKDNKLCSINIEEYLCFIRELKVGSEETTTNIPNVKPEAIKNLDECGIIHIGTEVKEGDILVGKTTKKTDIRLSPEEKLLQAIFGEKIPDSVDSSLRVPIGTRGTVIDVQILIRSNFAKDKRKLSIEDDNFKKLKYDIDYEYKIFRNKIIKEIEILINKYNKITKNFNITIENFIKLNIKDAIRTNKDNRLIATQLKKKKKEFNVLKASYFKKIDNLDLKVKDHDDLSPGVNKLIKILIAARKPIQVGDKLSGRHGNKGVVSIIVPVEDMPYLSDGTTVEIVLNPLGVPSRMNIGQLLETHLGFASKELGKKLRSMSKISTKIEIRNFIDSIYNFKSKKLDVNLYSDSDLEILSKNLENGIPFATPIFDGVNENEIKKLLKISGFSESGKTTLYDGRTGLPFDNEITIGYQYIMKLNHLVDDKIHARSTGPYSIVTQQPLGGRAQFGGQRFGEMEVWALEAYGAAYTLLEILTVKSDDMKGRTKLYKNIIDNNPNIVFGVPEAFNVLMKELLAVGINIELDKE